jgi:diaminopimelate epimerase
MQFFYNVPEEITVIHFTKMQGNGNDFIVIDNMTGQWTTEWLSRAAVSFCRRRHSLGADGVLVVEPSSGADFTMRLFNADGSEGEMCGNGARCIARYAFEKNIAGREQRFSTLAGVMEATVDSPFVDLRMGAVSLEDGWFNRQLRVLDETFPASFLWVGVPHAVIFPDKEFSRERMIQVGRTLRNDSNLFPDGANVNFVSGGGEGAIRSVTYERGVEDLTDSCGTGSTASALCWMLREGCPSVSHAVVDVLNPGGVNTVTLSFLPDGMTVEAALKGRTVIVAEGLLTEESK